MGVMINGHWYKDRDSLVDSQGRLQRPSAAYRHWITPDGSPGPSGDGGFAAEPGRYHLYVSRACPWAHRTTIFRRLKGLGGMIGLSVTHWHMGEYGWTFEPGPGVRPDPLHPVAHLYQLYARGQHDYSGRVTVPVLWDMQRECIVSNESADIIRMFNSAFDPVGATPGDYYPAALRGQIEQYNARIYDTLNNGVYKAGFATSQHAYEEAIGPLFHTLDWLEGILGGQRYLCGEVLTEADWRLFTTLLRFDLVYHYHFKCNLRRLVDYPALWSYTRELYQHPGISDTVDFEHIKRHYFQSHPKINPSGIVPLGPTLDFRAPSSR